MADLQSLQSSSPLPEEAQPTVFQPQLNIPQPVVDPETKLRDLIAQRDQYQQLARDPNVGGLESIIYGNKARGLNNLLGNFEPQINKIKQQDFELKQRETKAAIEQTELMNQGRKTNQLFEEDKLREMGDVNSFQRVVGTSYLPNGLDDVDEKEINRSGTRVIQEQTIDPTDNSPVTRKRLQTMDEYYTETTGDSLKKQFPGDPNIAELATQPFTTNPKIREERYKKIQEAVSMKDYIKRIQTRGQFKSDNPSDFMDLARMMQLFTQNVGTSGKLFKQEDIDANKKFREGILKGVSAIINDPKGPLKNLTKQQREDFEANLKETYDPSKPEDVPKVIKQTSFLGEIFKLVTRSTAKDQEKQAQPFNAPSKKKDTEAPPVPAGEKPIKKVAGKKEVARQYSKNQNKTRIEFDDGTMMLLSGKVKSGGY